MTPRGAALVLCVTLAACGPGRPSGPPPASAASPLVSRAIPAFQRPALDGTTVDTARLRGRPVVVKFFATYCKPCEKTLPALQRLAARRGDVAFVGIDEDASASDAATMVERFALTFPVVHDREQVLSGRFRVSSMPVTFVVDRGGTVRWVGDEGASVDDIERAIDAHGGR